MNPPRGWPAWLVTWAAILGSSLAGAAVLSALSLAGERVALETALDDHLAAVAGTADGALHQLPIETLVALGGELSGSELTEAIDNLAIHGNLRGLALLGPDGVVLGHGGVWLPLAAERDLIDRARAGSVVTGPLYEDGGQLYLTAYSPLTSHPGWVVAVEGSAATLGAIDTLRETQAYAMAAVVLVATLVSVALAAVLSRPIARLGAELAQAQPGTPPDALGDYGFREVRQVATAARGLLGAIRTRDAELQEAHRREVEQLTRMAAGLAHEVGNPLNAIALSVERLAVLEDPVRRGVVVTRIRGQLAELEGIVDRLRDLTRPLAPQLEPVDLGVIIDGVEVLTTLRSGRANVVTDPVLVGQVLRNLLLNASQAGARQAQVTVEPHGAVVRIDICDDGPGLSDEQVPQVFDWFHTTRATGSGLGLPVCRRIAEALGGSIELISARPACFRLTLPATPSGDTP